MKTSRNAMKNTRRISICATSIAAFMAATPDSPGVSYDVNLGDTFTEAGIVGGATGLTKTGGGALILTNAGNTYTGTTTISDGSVVISAASALGADPSAIVVTGFNPTIGQATNLRGFGGGQLVLSGLGGAITISRDLSLQGQGPIADRSGALISIGNNILSGTVNTGELAFGLTNINTNIISAVGTLGITGTLNVQGTALTTVTGLGGTNQGGVANYNLTGVLAGTGVLSKLGGGTLFLNPSSTAGFSGTIRTNGSNASGQSSIRITTPGVLGTRAATGTGSVLDLNGGVLEVLMDSPSLLQAGTAPANVYGRTSTTLFADKGVGLSSASNQTLALGQFAFEEAQTFTFNSRNGYGISFGVAPVQGGNNNSTFNNNIQGGLLTFTGNFWSNTDNTGSRTFNLGGNGNTLIDGNIVASAATNDHSFTKTGTGTLTVTGTGTTLDGNFNINGGTVATRRILGGLLGTGTAAGSLNIGTGGTTGTLDYLGAAGTGAGETVARNIQLAGTSGGARINANQSGSAPTALVISTLGVSSTSKTLTLGGASGLDNEITAAITNPATGAVSLTKADSGTWVLSGANTYTGTTTISNGTLKLKANGGASTVLGDTSAVAFNADGTTQAAGGRLLLAGSPGVATTESIGTVTPTQGHGTIRVENGGALTTLAVAGLSASSASIAASVNFEAPTALDVVTLGGAAGFVRGNVYYNGANFAFGDAGNVLRAPVYGTDAGFVTTAAGPLTAASHNEVTGTFSDPAGITVSSLKLTGNNTLTLTGTLAVNLGNQTVGGLLVDNGDAVIAQGGGGAITQGTGAGAAGGALVVRVNQATDSLTLNVPITSSTTQGLAKNGLGTLILGAANAQTGTTNINEGTVQLATGGRLSAANTNLALRQGATLDLNGVTQPSNTIGALNGAGTVTNSNATAAEFAFGNNGQAGTFSGLIQDGVGKVNVLKQSTGTVSLTGLNTYTGSTTIASTGTLSVTNLANIGSASGIGIGDATSNATNAGSLIFTGAQNVSATTGIALPGALNYTGTSNVTTDRLFTLGGTAAFSGARIASNGVNNVGVIFSNTAPIAYTAGGNTTAQNLVLAGASTADNRIDLQLVDPSSSTLQVNKIDGGKWVLGNGSNSYSGATKINGGALEVGSTALPTTSALLFAGTLAIPAGGVLETDGSFTRALNPGTVANTVNFNANGNFAGSGGFASSGNKLTVNLGGASAGLTWASGGFMMAGTSAATLRLNSTTALGEVEFQNPIDFGASLRTIQVDDNPNIGADFATLSGVLSGAGGGPSKTGGGTLAFTGANTYTGTTAVTAGTLVVRSLGSSSTPGATSVGDSAAGNTDAGAVTLGNGGTGAAILQYVGAGETSDRKIRLNTTTGNTQIHADGSGALVLTNVANDAATGAKGLFLRGTNTAGNRITNILTDSPTTGALSVTVDGSATWILDAANTYTGNTNSNAGALGVGNNAAFGPSGTVVLSNGNMFAWAADRTVANTVQIQNNAAQGFLGDFNLTFSSPLRLQGGGNAQINNSIPSTAGKALTFTGVDLNFLTANCTMTVDGPGETVINGDMTGTTAFGLSIVKTGSGVLVLNGGGGNSSQNNNTLDIDNGIVRLGATNALLGTATSAMNVVFSPDNNQAESPVLNLNGFSQTIAGLTGTNSSASAIDNASGTAVTLTIGNNNGAINSNAAITASGGGAISLVKTGTAAGVLSGTNINLGGTTTVSNGSLAFTGDDPNTTTGITVAGNAGLSLIQGVGSTFGSLTSLNLGAAAQTTALGLDVGTVTDTLAIAGAATTAGTVNFSIGAAPGFGTFPKTLLSAGSGLSGATYALNGVVPGGYTYSLTTSDTSVVLNATPTAAGVFFWRGDLNNSWTGYNSGNTNWEDAGGSDTAATPGPQDVVVFSSTINPPASPLVTTLDLPVQIDSMQFNGSTTSTAARVSIAAGAVANVLTIAPASSSDGIEIADGGGVASISAPIALAADQTWTVGSVGTLRPELIVTGPLTGTGNLTKLGAGTATVTGTSTRTGRTIIDAGTLRINAEAALGANPGAPTANQLSLNGGTLRSTAGLIIDDSNRGITLGGLGGVFDTAGGNITVESTNVITGAGGLRKESGNTLILNAANTYGGGTFVNGGAVRAGNSAAFGPGTVTLGNTTILEVTEGVNVANAVSISNNGNDKIFRTVAGVTNATLSGPITIGEQTVGNVRFQTTPGATLTVTGAITSLDANSTAGIRVNENAGQTGVLVLGGTPGANTYLGPTEVRQGTLRNGADDVIPNNVVVNAAQPGSPTATYDLNGFNETITGLTFGANGSSTAAYVNKVTTGFGTLTLGGNVTTVANPGGSQVSTAVLEGNVAMAATRTFTVANATTVQTDLLVSAAITGAGGLTKAGAGTMEMSGASTYAGTTTVNAGTLLVTGSISGAVSVANAAATLAGTGSVGAINATAGTVAPGPISGIGTLTAPSLTMTAATFALEINTTSTTNDLLSTSAPLSLALGGTPLTVTDLGANVALAQGTRFTFLNYSGAQTGVFSVGGTPINDDVDSFLLGANLFAIDYNDFGGTAVSLVVVPEPGIAVSLLGGFGMLVGLQRIRRRTDRRS